VSRCRAMLAAHGEAVQAATTSEGAGPAEADRPASWHRQDEDPPTAGALPQPPAARVMGAAQRQNPCGCRIPRHQGQVPGAEAETASVQLCSQPPDFPHAIPLASSSSPMVDKAAPTPDPTLQALVAVMGMTASIVLAADDPAALARFYGALLDVEPQPGLSSAHWRVRWPAGGWLEVYAPSKSRQQPRQQGRLALCLQRQADGTGALPLLHAWISKALDLGAYVQDLPRQESFGAEAWLLDPEGNRLLLLVLPAS